MGNDGISEHTIPADKLKNVSFTSIGNIPGCKKENIILINGIKADRWITNVKVEHSALEFPKVIVYGRLEKLDEEIKKSWGII